MEHQSHTQQCHELSSLQIAEEIRYVIDSHDQPIPAVLEIPSKDSPYDSSKDSILRRAKVKLLVKCVLPPLFVLIKICSSLYVRICDYNSKQLRVAIDMSKVNYIQYDNFNIHVYKIDLVYSIVYHTVYWGNIVHGFHIYLIFINLP